MKIEDDQSTLMYLKGFLGAISALNSFTNEYLIAQVNIHNINPESSLEVILNDICQTDKYVYTINRIGNMESELKRILPKYTERFIIKIAETRHYPFWGLDKEQQNEIINEIKNPIDEINFSFSICDQINKLLKNGDEFYKVKIDDSLGPFYSLENDTFLIKGINRAIFIKFGISD